jgi:hypothetical protein
VIHQSPGSVRGFFFSAYIEHGAFALFLHGDGAVVLKRNQALHAVWFCKKANKNMIM